MAISTEGFSFFFVAGVAIGAILANNTTHFYLLSGISFAAAWLLLAASLPKRLLPDMIRIAILPFMLFATGFFTGITGSGVSSPDSITFPEKAALGTVSRLRSLIDEIPFAHEGTAPLLKALLTGDKSSLSKETVAVFRSSGASHLLALSGLHIGIIYLIFKRLTFLFGNSPSVKILRGVITVLFAGFFTLMVGGSPSIVRAFLFILISEAASLLHRKRDSLKVLCLALIIQLSFSPEVIFSPGFQLSYAAMLGIFLIFPWLSSFYPGPSGYDPMHKIWEAAALSISCQVTTAPIAWHYFHSFPKYFLLTNLLAIPMTTCLIGTSLLTIVLYALGLCPPLFIQLTDFLSRLLTGILSIIGSM